MDKLDFKNVASAALAAADNLLAEWLPSGRYKGHEFYALNPTARISTSARLWSIRIRASGRILPPAIPAAI